MALANYTDLQAAVKDYLGGRGDVSTQVVDFIKLAESRLNAELPVREAEIDDTSLTGTVDSRDIALPSGFLEPIALFLTTWGTQEKLAPIIAGNYELHTTSGPPEAWFINGSNISLNKPCDQEHTFLFRYRKKLFDLANTATNWLLTNHPNVYLFATLREAAIWERDPDEAIKYEALMKQAIAQARWIEGRSKSVAPLRVDPAIGAVGSFNINSGDADGVG